MAYINQKTWNLISILFGIGYLLFFTIPIVDIGKHAFLMGFYKAIPVWMSAILAMVGNESIIGVALVFGSTGDIMLDIRLDETFDGDDEIRNHLFKLGVGLFLLQHILMVFQFSSYWQSFKTYSIFPYFITFNLLWFFILPNLPEQLVTISCIYTFILTTSCFLSINALSIPSPLKHEKFNLYASVLFLFSDSLVILEVIDLDKVKQNNDELMMNIMGFNKIIRKNVIMITYYLSQLLFANAGYNRYRYKRSQLKRK